MVLQSRLYNILPEGYGYVLLVGTGSVLVNTWMAINVSRARRKFGVDYPKMYSDDSNEFNCIQRAHQNTLENHPTFLFFLLTGGLQYPKCSAAAGLAYVLGRIVYAKGYYSGDPKKRRWGGFGQLGLLVLMGGTISFATYLLGLIDPKNKKWGAFDHLGLLALMGSTISFAAYLLDLIGEPPDCCGRCIAQ